MGAEHNMIQLIHVSEYFNVQNVHPWYTHGHGPNTEEIVRIGENIFKILKFAWLKYD